MKKLLVLLIALANFLAHAQVIIPSEPTEKSAELQIDSKNKAVLFPRLSSTEIAAIANPAHGLLVYNLTKQAFVFNIGTEASPSWQVLDDLILNTTLEIQAIPTPSAGDVRYNTTTKSVYYYNGVSKVWEEICEDPQCQAFIVTNSVNSNADCFGVANGNAQVNIAGGTAPFFYAWSDAGATTQTRTDLLAGAYSITVTDSKGCVKTTSLTINQPTEITYTLSVTNADCRDTANGQITVSASGGNGSFDYSNNGGSTWQANSNFQNLPAGSYNISVRDNAVPSCIVTYGSNPVSISQPAALSMAVSTTNVNCYGVSDGEIDITPSGGGGNYLFSLNGGSSWQASSIFSNISAGVYNIFIKDSDASNCTIAYWSNPVTISQPTEITYTVAKVDVTSNGANDGQISITASGGSGGNLEYSIDDGLNFQSSNSFTNLTPGDYNVVVRDADIPTCEVSYSANPVSVTEPGAINISVAKQNVNCNGSNNGSITITATSTDVTNFEYSIDGGINWYSANSFTNLPPSSYSISVRDRDDVVNTKNYNLNPVVISEPAVLTVSISSTDADCFGDSNGSITVSAGGGSGTYGYSSDNGSTWQASNVFTGLAAGNYDIVLRDANATSCQIVNASNPIAVPDELIITETITNVSCHTSNDGTKNDGAIDLVITGGNGGFTYNWANGTGSGSSNGNGANQSSLTTGTYSVTVTDVKGCSKNESYTVSQPTAIAISNITIGNVSCHTNNSGTKNDGTISVAASGGTGALTYDWTDGTGTGSNDGNGANQTGLIIGTYSVQISDSRACSKTQSNIAVSQPAEFVASISATWPKDVTCNGNANGEIQLEVAGGTGSVYDVQIQDRFTYINNLSFPLLIDSLSGFTSKTISVRDENNCVDQITNVSVGEPNILSATGTVNPVTCNGDSDGSISLSVTGGNVPYSYVWSNAATTKDISGLSGNTYSVTITDSKLCAFNLSKTVTEPTILSVSSSITHVTCYNAFNGAVDVSVSGGNGSYTYLWNVGNTTQDISGLNGSTYTVTVTDNKGCYESLASTVNEPVVLTATHSVTNTLDCYGDTDGAATINPSGGTLPYSYNWPTGSDIQSRNDLAAGNYTVTITDNNSCTTTRSVTIGTPSVISIGSTVSVAACGSSVGSVELDASGGTPISGTNYDYSNDNATWQTNLATYEYTNLAAGSYTFYARDNNGCVVSQSITVGGTIAMTIIFSNIDTLATCGNEDGSAEVTVTGGTAFGNGYDFNWDGLGNERQLSGFTKNLRSGVHNVVVTDANGCKDSGTVIIDLPGIEFSDDGNGVAVISDGNEAYWQLKRCGDLNINNLSCSCNGTIYTWDDTYDYFISATGDVLLPIDGSCTSISTSNLYGHPDEGSMADTDLDGQFDYNSADPTNAEVNFSNSRSDQYQFDARGTDNVFDKDNLIVSPVITTSDKPAQFFDYNSPCNSGADCFATYGSAVAYCPTDHNEPRLTSNLYTADAVVEGNVLQQSMDSANSICISNFGYGWRLPTLQEIQYSYNFSGTNPQFDPAYYHNALVDGQGGMTLCTSTKASASSDKIYRVEAKAINNANSIYATSYNSTGLNWTGGYNVRCVFDTDLPLWNSCSECTFRSDPCDSNGNGNYYD